MSYQPARLFDPARDGALIPQLAQIHHDCIKEDHTMASFLPPLHLPDIIAYWQDWVEETKTSSRKIFVQTIQHADREEAVGVVSLFMPASGTGPFRSKVHKLLVSPRHRYKGVARELMRKLEEYAKTQGRWLIMLDTTIGTGAEHVYPKLGYITLGTIPNYGFSPKDGKLRDEMFFYKDIRDPGTITERSVV